MYGELSDSYNNEFGTVSPVVNRAAVSILEKTQAFANRVIHDEHLGNQLLSKATANVSRVLDRDAGHITNLPGFLLKSYKRLVLAEAKKRQYRSDLEAKWINDVSAKFGQLSHNPEEKLIQDILLKEVTAQMDDWTREVYQLRVLGYEYRDLVPKYGRAENAIRSKLSKKIARLARIFTL
jgi:pyruvate-formate lyase